MKSLALACSTSQSNNSPPWPFDYPPLIAKKSSTHRYLPVASHSEILNPEMVFTSPRLSLKKTIWIAYDCGLFLVKSYLRKIIVWVNRELAVHLAEVLVSSHKSIIVVNFNIIVAGSHDTEIRYNRSNHFE
jgi:hypothetical protein